MQSLYTSLQRDNYTNTSSLRLATGYENKSASPLSLTELHNLYLETKYGDLVKGNGIRVAFRGIETHL